MRKTYFILLLLVGGFVVMNAQVTDVVTGLGQPAYMDSYENELYFIQSSTNKISKIDLTDSQTNIIDVITNISGPAGLTIDGSKMYYSSSVSGKIFKVDLAIPNDTSAEVTTLANGQGAIIIEGTNLYTSNTFSKEVVMIDLTDTSYTPQVLLSGVTSTALAFNDGILYVSQPIDDKVIGINLKETPYTIFDVVTGVDFPQGLLFIGNDLYISASSDSKIVKVDVTQPLPMIMTTDVVTMTTPFSLFFDGNDMYAADLNDRIVKFNIFPVSTKELKTLKDWIIFPNPATDYINFKGLQTQQQYIIVDAIGRVIQTGTAYPNDPISIEQLSQGTYIIRLENGEIEQFLKQ